MEQTTSTVAEVCNSFLEDVLEHDAGGGGHVCIALVTPSDKRVHGGKDRRAFQLIQVWGIQQQKQRADRHWKRRGPLKGA